MKSIMKLYSLYIYIVTYLKLSKTSSHYTVVYKVKQLSIRLKNTPHEYASRIRLAVLARNWMHVVFES